MIQSLAKSLKNNFINELSFNKAAGLLPIAELNKSFVKIGRGHNFCRTSLPLNASIYHFGCATRGEGGRPPPALSWKVKKVLWFWKKGPDCVHLWVKFSIQNVVLTVSRRKKSQTFPCEAFFCSVFDKILIQVAPL